MSRNNWDPPLRLSDIRNDDSPEPVRLIKSALPPKGTQRRQKSPATRKLAEHHEIERVATLPRGIGEYPSELRITRNVCESANGRTQYLNMRLWAQNANNAWVPLREGATIRASDVTDEFIARLVRALRSMA